MISIDIPLIFSIFEMILSAVVITITGLYILRFKTNRWGKFFFIGCLIGLIVVHRIMDIETRSSDLLLTKHFFIKETIQLLLTSLLLFFIIKHIIVTFKQNKEKQKLENEFYSSILIKPH